MPISENTLKMMGIFHPHAVDKYRFMYETRTRFVHYCSAEAAYHILGSGVMRLRNASVMNDFSEIEHGAKCLSFAWSGKPGEQLREFIESLYPGLSKEIQELVNSWLPTYKNETYITCMSEHDDAEDNLGRLSMWRAYGGAVGVAVVINPTVFLEESDAIPASTSPVAYMSELDFAKEFSRVVKNMIDNADIIKSIGRSSLKDHLYHAFRMSILCTKHPGFREEREWRIVYSPLHNPSDRVTQSIHVINGVPQAVYNIPFKDYPDEGLVGAELPKLINRVIIGPTEFPYQVRKAIVSLLEKKNVNDAENKVVCSSIPLRQ